MRRILILVSLAAILLMGAKGAKVRELTIRNKSGAPLAVSLWGEEQARVYYFHVPVGDRVSPTDTTFSIPIDKYRMRVFYLEESLSYAGSECRTSQDGTLILTRNIRVTVLECDRRPPNNGEPGMYKMGRERCLR